MATYLISYPRSGNTWLRYIIEYLSERPTDCSFNTGELPICCNDPIENPLIRVGVTSPVILMKSHGDKITNSKHNRLILLTRTPSDSIYSQMRLYAKQSPYNPFQSDSKGNPAAWDLLRWFIKKQSHWVRQIYRFIRLLHIYDRWKGEKILVTYEDLIAYPRQFIDQLIQFLNIDDRNVNAFLRHYKAHKDISLSLYTQGKIAKGDSRTRGRMDTAKPLRLDTLVVEIL